MLCDSEEVQSSIALGGVNITCCHRLPSADTKWMTLQNNMAPIENAGSPSTCAGAAPLPCQPADDDIGLDVWPATDVLCQYISEHPGFVRSPARVLELGSGVGVAGILALALGAASVTLTDYGSQTLSVLRRNVALNGFSDCGRVEALDWKSWRGSQPTLGTFGTILGADLLYVTNVVQDFLEVLKLLLAPDGVFLYAHQMRQSILLDKETRRPCLEGFDAPLERFLVLSRAAGLEIRQLHQTEDKGHSEFRLYRVGWRNEGRHPAPDPAA